MAKRAFLFPGQGSQSVGMGRELFASFPAARQLFLEANDALRFDLTKLIFEGPEEQLRLTEFTQPAIFTVSAAAYRVLVERVPPPDFAAGHSLGEYSACYAAGAVSFWDAVQAVRKRGQWMQEAVPEGQGAMAAILGMKLEAVLEILEQAARETGLVVTAANRNSPEQIAISGSKQAVERAIVLAKERGAKRAVMLQVSAPFHCPLMQPAQDALAKALAEIPFADATVPVVVNVEAKPLTDGEALRDALVRQVTGAVLWTESMQWLLAQGVTSFIEVGPGKVLSGLLRQIDRSQKALHVDECLAAAAQS